MTLISILAVLGVGVIVYALSDDLRVSDRPSFIWPGRRDR